MYCKLLYVNIVIYSSVCFSSFFCILSDSGQGTKNVVNIFYIYLNNYNLIVFIIIKVSIYFEGLYENHYGPTMPDGRPRN